MALPNDLFHLLEFEDGIQVVPNNWVQKDINKYIIKAIKKRQTPQDNWLMYPIKRIFDIYDSYSEARNKLKKAEMNSDINTDTDDKAQRKIRARKQIDTDDDESDDDHDSDPLCLPSYPKAPVVVYTRNTRKHTQKGAKEYIKIK
ncbi:hypothetical protein ACFW04_001321 [Cataglyphis niger]